MLSSFIASVALLSAAQVTSLNRLANGTCNAQVRPYTSTGDEYGYERGGKRVVYVARDREASEARRTVFHECCHIAGTQAPATIFGIPPFVSDRSRTPAEDMCESYAYFRTGILRTGPKATYFRTHNILTISPPSHE